MTNNKQKILFVIPSLGGGGAEKVAVQLMTHLDREKYSPLLVLFEKKGDFLKDIPEDIPIYDLKKKNRHSFFSLIKELSRIIRKTSPSLIFGFIIYANIVSLLARILSQRKIPLVIGEHSVPIQSLKSGRYFFVKRMLFKFLYSKADLIITVSRGVKNELINHWRINPGKVRVISNAVDVDRISRLSRETVHYDENNKIPKLIAVGRLSKPKGYFTMLKAIKKVVEHYPVRLTILGDGWKKQKLKDLTDELGISQCVRFLGFQKNPYQYIAKADLFIQSSLWESFGIVIIEAMACGVPVIATRCPYGPEEIINDGVNGVLVPKEDENALAESIVRLLNDNLLREKMIKEGRKRLEDFRINKVISKYENVFENLV